jgi:signal transduction histidine kinase
MSGAQPIAFNPSLIAAVAAAIVGFAAFWANPERGTNRAFFSCSIHAAAWLITLQLALTAQQGQGLFWLQLSCSVGGLLPLHIWVIQQILSDRLEKTVGSWLRANWLWLGLSLCLAIVPFTDFFIPPHSTATSRLRGWGYYGYMLVDGGLYCALFVDAFRRSKTLVGVRRLELQVWLAGACLIAVVVLGLMAAAELGKNRSLLRLQPLVIFVFYGATAYAITSHRIFNARQVLLWVSQKLLLVGTVAALVYVVDVALQIFIPEPFDFLITTAIGLWFAGTFNRWLDRILHIYPEAQIARQAAFAAARSESKTDELERAFLEILKGWGHSTSALVLAGTKESYRGTGIELPGENLVVTALRQLRWATPERLTRERTSPERVAVAGFLVENNLGALVITEGQTLSLIVGVGVPVSRRPFTYPQITQLSEIGSIMVGALERAHLAIKAQHAEQLATVGLLGASFAHEIRNPLVTIKTFVQLLPNHYQDPVFREKFFALIGDEVSRIDRLTEQLLDLASPRAYHARPIELHPILRTSVELVAAKATDKRIELFTDFRADSDRVLTDPSATKQVLLNLCFNAIQAVELVTGERWVKIATCNVDGGVEVIVSDSGPGIAPEIRPRLFQPFQTTKSSGFGLGLAICRDILGGLDATIAVDPSQPGQGATFRIVFPCPA